MRQPAWSRRQRASSCRPSAITQILAWGSSYYLPAVLAKPIADDTGWSLTWVIGGVSLGLLVAGLVSPLVGRQIHRHGGRPVLIASAILLAAGQLGLASAPNLPVFLAAWLVIGLGMSAGLYDAAFSTLGRIYGQEARQHITTLTLFGGFASTVCWPLSAFFLQELGWRGACVAYAAIQLVVCLGIYLLALPREQRTGAPPRPAGREKRHGQRKPASARRLHPARGHDHHRLDAVDRHLRASADHPAGAGHHAGRRRRPGRDSSGHRRSAPASSRCWSASIIIRSGPRSRPSVSSRSGSACCGVICPIIALTLVFYGAGIGLESIARATLPLVLFGARDYAPIMGRLARPSLIAQAAAPSIGAYLILRLGTDGALATLVAVACVNVLLVLCLFAAQRKASR